MLSTRTKRAKLVRSAVRANVWATADDLRHGSGILERLLVDDGSLSVDADYSLATGEVDFFDGVSGSD